MQCSSSGAGAARFGLVVGGDQRGGWRAAAGSAATLACTRPASHAKEKISVLQRSAESALLPGSPN